MLVCDTCGLRWQSTWWHDFLLCGIEAEPRLSTRAGPLGARLHPMTIYEKQVTPPAEAPAVEVPPAEALAALPGKKCWAEPKAPAQAKPEAALEVVPMAKLVAYPVAEAIPTATMAAATELSPKKSFRNLSPALAPAMTAVSAKANAAPSKWACAPTIQRLDCGKCPHCLDKPKFGGPNIRKKCCSNPQLTCGGVLNPPVAPSRAKPSRAGDAGGTFPPRKRPA